MSKHYSVVKPHVVNLKPDAVVFLEQASVDMTIIWQSEDHITHYTTVKAGQFILPEIIREDTNFEFRYTGVNYWKIFTYLVNFAPSLIPQMFKSLEAWDCRVLENDRKIVENRILSGEVNAMSRFYYAEKHKVPAKQPILQVIIENAIMGYHNEIYATDPENVEYIETLIDLIEWCVNNFDIVSCSVIKLYNSVHNTGNLSVEEICLILKECSDIEEDVSIIGEEDEANEFNIIGEDDLNGNDLL